MSGIEVCNLLSFLSKHPFHMEHSIIDVDKLMDHHLSRETKPHKTRPSTFDPSLILLSFFLVCWKGFLVLLSLALFFARSPFFSHDFEGSTETEISLVLVASLVAWAQQARKSSARPSSGDDSSPLRRCVPDTRRGYGCTCHHAS